MMSGGKNRMTTLISGEEITYKDESGDIEYRIYGYKMDLSELFNGESTREAIDEFKKAVLINLGCDIN